MSVMCEGLTVSEPGATIADGTTIGFIMDFIRKLIGLGLAVVPPGGCGKEVMTKVSYQPVPRLLVAFYDPRDGI